MFALGLIRSLFLSTVKLTICFIEVITIIYGGKSLQAELWAIELRSKG
jgi:hypothetical protein